MHFDRIVIAAFLLALGGCRGSERLAENAAAEGNAANTMTAALSTRVGQGRPASVIGETAMNATPRSCAAEIGAAAAARRAKVCLGVSPATHPPCNAANSCAMIEDEIARSCALFDGDGPPMKGCDVKPKSAQAAADVVRRYYAAIDARDYATAWQQWGDDGRPGQSYKAFENGFAHTRSTRVTIGALKPGDGAAGSVYQPVPVTVEATLNDGSAQRFIGTYIVRRVNDVDGASASQLRWHIDSAQLRRVPSD